MPEFHCDLAQTGSPLAHIWSHTIGSDHARMALRADWQEQMRRTHEELGVRYVRFHGLLDDDMASLLDEQDNLLYGFHNADLIVDFLRSIDMHPFVELSFMPSALASGATTVFRYRGNVTPPRDIAKWEELIDRLVRHWVARYGIDEVRQWYFEVWNEPNLSAFWTGSQADYFELYRHTVTTIKAIDGGLRVGGPASASDAWIDEFIAFCTREKLAYDFISTHHYPTDAFGKPGDNTEQQLALATRDILKQRTQETCAKAGATPLCYTEWSSSSNPFFKRHDEPYAAAFLVKNFLDVADLVTCYSYWTFSDIFAENYFSSLPFHGGFGLLTIDGIAKPTFRGIQLLCRLGDERLTVDGSHATVDASVARAPHAVIAILTNHAFPQHPITSERVSLVLHGAKRPTRIQLERVDENHCNPRKLWEAFGSPEYPSPAQLKQLHDASELRHEALDWQDSADGVTFSIDLPAHAVAAITLDYAE
jgi:xylan 1,4-beta-xylosidase